MGSEHSQRPVPTSATGSRFTTTNPIRYGTFGKHQARLSSCERGRAPTIRSVHLFDEPQFNTQDGYIGFMLDVLSKACRREGRIVFLCVHPERAIPSSRSCEEICEQFIFVNRGTLTHAPDFESLLGHEPARAYLGDLVE